MEKLRLHKTDLVDEALMEVLQHKDLQQMFFKLFDAADDDSVSNKFNW